MNRGLQMLCALSMGAVCLTGCGGTQTATDAPASADSHEVVIGVAWSNEPDALTYTSTIEAAQETGARVVALDMVLSHDLDYVLKNLKDAKLLENSRDEGGMLSMDAAKRVKVNRHLNSNAAQVMEGVDCVIFPGGGDISPTLCYTEEEPVSTDTAPQFCAERDVSDYLLMEYCLEEDIPAFGIDRGMQMMGVVSGAQLIQDMGVYYDNLGFDDPDTHMDPAQKDFLVHGADLVSDSHIAALLGAETLSGCPSWHHQMIGDTFNTRLEVTAVDNSGEVPVTEAIERPDRTCFWGVQFHPEIAVHRAKSGSDNGTFFSYETAMRFFNDLYQQAQTAKSR